jgi:cytochrome bd-type quinol oxidase subunit 1
MTNDEPPRQPPLQFRLRTMLIVTAVFAAIFAVLKWLDVPPRVSLIVLILLGVSTIAALGLVVVIAGSVARGDDREPGRGNEAKSDRESAEGNEKGTERPH